MELLLHQLRSRAFRRAGMVVVWLVASLPVSAQQTFQLSGLLSGSAAWLDEDPPAFEVSPLPELDPGFELRLGAEWYPHPMFRLHADLLARDERPDRRREQLGIVEAYAEANLRPRNQRFRIKAGAFFLPTSREHVDAFWKNPYTINASALNSWFGEEFRPIGIDVDYHFSGLTLGATAYRGNDAFGSIIVDRGWTLNDNVALLDERIDLFPGAITSISPELDGRTGWAGRFRWSNPSTLFQITHIDNEADGLQYGDIITWQTPFWVVGFEHTRGDWTFIGESGWGTTVARTSYANFEAEMDASYVLISRRFSASRLSARLESFYTDYIPEFLPGYSEYRTEALTVAWFWTPPGRIRAGIELSATEEEARMALHAEYAFSLR